ncbi:MAG: methionyl-tRNA formyltransferase [Parachlamydiales bacterium]|nr:methionyl-tRNA formyltransferase [Parachlamydiales bacterium]
MKVIYFGTPNFSAEILSYLAANNIEIVAIVTQIDKSKKDIPEVKKTAEMILPNVKILQPKSASDPEFIESLKKFEADLFIVVAYGQILKQSLLDIPKKGCINVHASLLPKYRGANPIRYAILNGDKKTGISIMKMVKKMDAGDVILTDEVEILDSDDFGSLEKKLIKITKPLLLKVIKLFEENNVKYTPQSEINITFANKIKFEDRIIDWNNLAKNILNQIRAFSPSPGAIAKIILDSQEKNLKILKAQICEEKSKSPKSIIYKNDSLFIGCKDYYLELLIVQLEGKNKLHIEDFLRGLKKDISFK